MRKAVRGNGEEIWSPGGVSLSPTSTCSSTGSSLHPLLWGLYGGFVTEMRLMKSLATGDWTQSPDPLPSPEWGRTGGGGGTDNSNPLITSLASLAIRLHPPVNSKVSSLIWQKTPSWLSPSKGLKALKGAKTKYTLGWKNWRIKITWCTPSHRL